MAVVRQASMAVVRQASMAVVAVAAAGKVIAEQQPGEANRAARVIPGGLFIARRFQSVPARI